jgi:malate dehydrogenase (oxaloacetate-decarboxylating)
MFVAAARALAEVSPALVEEGAPLYPRLESVREVSRLVALAVGREAQRSGLVAALAPGELEDRVGEMMWAPHYVPFVRRDS